MHHWNRVGTPTMTLRSPEQITRFSDGLELLEPGLVPCSQWRPDVTPRPDVGTGDAQPDPVDEYGVVARKP